MPCTRPRRLFRSPIRVPANSSGASISTFMMGSSRQGLHDLHALAEGEPPRHLERHFVGVHVVVAAVVDRRLEIDDRIAGQIAARGRLDDALLDRGNEVAGNGAAEDFVGELEAAAAGQRLHPDLAVAELAVAAGLLFVPSLGLGLGRGSSRGREPWAPSASLRRGSASSAGSRWSRCAAGRRRQSGIRWSSGRGRSGSAGPLPSACGWRAPACLRRRGSWARWRRSWRARAVRPVPPGCRRPSAPSVSPVRVSRSLATAPRSPACSSATSTALRPCITLR